MSPIITIFKKEILDSLRDRRTLLTMIVLPVVIVPLLMILMSRAQESMMESENQKILKIAFVSNGGGDALAKKFELNKKMSVLRDIPEDKIKELVKNDSIDAGIVLPIGYDSMLIKAQRANVDFIFDGSEMQARERVQFMLEKYAENIVEDRLESLGQDEEFIEPINIMKKNIYTRSETIAKAAGGLLPYFFVLFCFLGCLYPSIDLFAGEKERGTMETILSTPTSRFQLLFGKFLVVMLGGILSGGLTLLSLYISANIDGFMPPMMAGMFGSIFQAKSIFIIFLMLIPLAAFFAAIMIMASIYAKSYKEAQSLIMPMQIVIIMPLLAGFIPGIKLTPLTAIIPIANISLASKEIAGGTMTPFLYFLIFASLITFAAIAIFACVKWFGNERNILRT